MRHIVRAAIVTLILASGVPGAQAASWFGKIDLAESTAGRPMRFFARSSGLSLFARGEARAIMLAGFYAKATMSVGYHPIKCPGGITGPCSRVDFVSVDRGGNF